MTRRFKLSSSFNYCKGKVVFGKNEFSDVWIGLLIASGRGKITLEYKKDNQKVVKIFFVLTDDKRLLKKSYYILCHDLFKNLFIGEFWKVFTFAEAIAKVNFSKRQRVARLGLFQRIVKTQAGVFLEKNSDLEKIITDVRNYRHR